MDACKILGSDFEGLGAFREPGHGLPSRVRSGVCFGFRVQGSGSGFRVQGSGFRVQGSGFRV